MQEARIRVKKEKRKIFFVFTGMTLLMTFSFLFYRYGRSIWFPKYLEIEGKRTVQDVVSLYETGAEKRLRSYFDNTNIPYPPKKITFIAFKDTKELNLWAADAQDRYSFIHTYKIKGASGKSGPKLLEGDRQVPEGLYRVVGLNPNSSYHLSMKLNYPNKFDLQYAKREGRNSPGSNIFIHGKTVSVGCLAMGDRAIEELFILVYKVGLENIEVILAPTNLLEVQDKSMLFQNKPQWVSELYKSIQNHLQKYYK